MNNIWRSYHGALIPWTPPHLGVNILRDEIYADIIKSKSYFARWTTNFDTKTQSPFWYIINDKKVDLENYSVNTRSKINRGFKKLAVKKVSKNELINEGYNVYLNAIKRYNVVLNKISKKDFLDEINNLNKDWEFWGVYSLSHNKMVAYSMNRIVDDYCDYSTIKFDPSYLKDYSSYVLYYSMNKYYLNDCNFSYVNNGTRSISHQTNIHDFLIDKFFFRKAYCEMEIMYSPFFKFLVNTFYSFRSLISIIPFDFFRKLYVVLYQEEINKFCKLVFSKSNKDPVKLILSNGNFKSGSTWVTAIVRELYDYSNDTFPVTFQNPKYSNWINRFKIGEFLDSDFLKGKKIWISKSHITEDKLIRELLIHQHKTKIINIDRDIKDVLVSHYYHLLNSKKIKGDFSSYFYKWGRYKAKQIIDYKLSWKDYDCLKLDYSELHNSNKETILKIANYLNVKLDDDKISLIQKETDINNLRENSKKKKLNEEGWFYRKGKMGDWKKHFDNKMIKKITQIESKKLSFYESFMFYIKFTIRLRFKYFLYKNMPFLYVKFDKYF